MKKKYIAMETRAKARLKEISATMKEETKEDIPQKTEFEKKVMAKIEEVNSDKGQKIINQVLQTVHAPFLYVQLVKSLNTWVQLLTPMRLGESTIGWKDIQEDWMIPMDNCRVIYNRTINTLHQMGFINSDVPEAVIESMNIEELQLQAIISILYLEKMMQQIDLVDDHQFKKESKTINEDIMLNNSPRVKVEHIPYRINTTKSVSQKIHKVNLGSETKNNSKWHKDVIDVESENESDDDSTGSNDKKRGKKLNVLIAPE